jgi:release factor glutamine methyltransferase
MKSVKDVSAAFRQELSGLYDTREADSLCMIALAEATGTSPAKMKAFPELEFSREQFGSVRAILDDLKTGKPIQYILGYAEFYGMTFKVNPSVLIPRPETEELIEWVLSSPDLDVTARGNMLDIGTGSGCIAISLKKHLPYFAVRAVDISEAALQTARGNALLNDVEIEFLLADILNMPLKSPVFGKYTMIISNPPYVTAQDKANMHQNVTGFEPHTALFVPEDDPLVFYNAIAGFAAANLDAGGSLFFEINENFGEQIVELLLHKRFNNIQLRKDMSGRDRMIKANFSGETK